MSNIDTKLPDPKYKNGLTIDTNLKDKVLSQSTTSVGTDTVVETSIGSSTDLSLDVLTDEISIEDTDSILEMSLKENLAREEQLMQDEEVMFQWRDLLTRSWKTDESTPKIPLTTSSSVCSKRTDYFGHASLPDDDRSGSHTSTPSRFLEEEEEDDDDDDDDDDDEEEEEEEGNLENKSEMKHTAKQFSCEATWNTDTQQNQPHFQRICQEALLPMNIKGQR
ncbi:hypothetical protein J3Q64DRAFT_1726238 [Phycomyces blakesleeanus]|uniref:Uncharacterized protein n=1 Tax=Phycomyces blakesleeanus TaxID=4837 RepID=A0ABR3B869_PHYBL